MTVDIEVLVFNSRILNVRISLCLLIRGGMCMICPLSFFSFESCFMRDFRLLTLTLTLILIVMLQLSVVNAQKKCKPLGKECVRNAGQCCKGLRCRRLELLGFRCAVPKPKRPKLVKELAPPPIECGGSCLDASTCCPGQICTPTILGVGVCKADSN